MPVDEFKSWIQKIGPKPTIYDKLEQTSFLKYGPFLKFKFTSWEKNPRFFHVDWELSKQWYAQVFRKVNTFAESFHVDWVLGKQWYAQVFRKVNTFAESFYQEEFSKKHIKIIVDRLLENYKANENPKQMFPRKSRGPIPFLFSPSEEEEVALKNMSDYITRFIVTIWIDFFVQNLKIIPNHLSKRYITAVCQEMVLQDVQGMLVIKNASYAELALIIEVIEKWHLWERHYYQAFINPAQHGPIARLPVYFWNHEFKVWYRLPVPIIDDDHRLREGNFYKDLVKSKGWQWHLNSRLLGLEQLFTTEWDVAEIRLAVGDELRRERASFPVTWLSKINDLTMANDWKNAMQVSMSQTKTFIHRALNGGMIWFGLEEQKRLIDKIIHAYVEILKLPVSEAYYLPRKSDYSANRATSIPTPFQTEEGIFWRELLETAESRTRLDDWKLLDVNHDVPLVLPTGPLPPVTLESYEFPREAGEERIVYIRGSNKS